MNYNSGVTYWVVSFSISDIGRFQLAIGNLDSTKIPAGLKGHGKPRDPVPPYPNPANTKWIHSIWSTAEGKTEEDLKSYLESLFEDTHTATVHLLKYDICFGKHFVNET